MKKFTLFLFLIGVMACTPEEKPSASEPKKELTFSTWKMIITLSDSVDLPLILTSVDTGDINFTIHNAEERIPLKRIQRKGDSIFMDMPVFQSGFEGVFYGDSMAGELVKYDAIDYRLPFYASKGDYQRFDLNNEDCCQLESKYEVTFRPEKENASKAIGEFKQEGNKVTGTFMTETGDYRYLEGVLDGRTLKLSAFDGNHLYAFKAVLQQDGSLKGRFFSGRSRADLWIGVANEDFQLADPESLTYLKDGESQLSFSFPKPTGKPLEYNKENYKGKVVIIQILGSWCPNCMDESRYLQSLYSKYHDQGLEVIGLSFERKRDTAIAFKAMEKMISDLQLSYPIAFAGSTRKEDREKALPQLNKIMSFPTSIYIDKNGNISKIHTGFSGQGTSAFSAFAEETENWVKESLESNL